MEDDVYNNIRDCEWAQELLGTKLLYITQNDPGDEDDGAFVELFFENGTALRFPVTERGFDIR